MDSNFFLHIPRQAYLSLRGGLQFEGTKPFKHYPNMIHSCVISAFTSQTLQSLLSGLGAVAFSCFSFVIKTACVLSPGLRLMLLSVPIPRVLHFSRYQIHQGLQQVNILLGVCWKKRTEVCLQEWPLEST